MSFTEEEILRAVDDAVSLLQEFDGGSLPEKLEAFGVSLPVLHAVVQERWETNRGRYEGEPPEVVFAGAYVEALLVGTKLRQEAERAEL